MRKRVRASSAVYVELAKDLLAQREWEDLHRTADAGLREMIDAEQRIRKALFERAGSSARSLVRAAERRVAASSAEPSAEPSGVPRIVQDDMEVVHALAKRLAATGRTIGDLTKWHESVKSVNDRLAQRYVDKERHLHQLQLRQRALMEAVRELKARHEHHRA